MRFKSWNKVYLDLKLMCSLFCISLIQDHCELCHFFLWSFFKKNAIDTYIHKKLNIFLFILVWMRKSVHHHKKAMQKIIGKFLADYIYWHVNGYYHQSNIIAHTFFSQQLNLHMMQWEKMICCIVKSVVKYEILSGNLLLVCWEYVHCSLLVICILQGRNGKN